MIPTAVTVFAGLCIAIAAISLGLWQILSAPDRPNYPTSGKMKRMAMFFVTAVLAVRATNVIVGAFADEPVYVNQDTALSAAGIAALFTIFLVDHMRNWLPARTQRRIRKLRDIATCKPSRELKAARKSAMAHVPSRPFVSADAVSPALVELQMQGAIVVGPNEGPKSLTGAD